MREPALDHLADDERTEEFESHFLRQAAFVDLQLRPHHDHRPAGIIHAFAQKILPETPLLAAKHIGEGSERPALRRKLLRPEARRIIYQRIHRLLEHALLVPHDHFRRLDL